MNQHLQNILHIIQQDENLTAEQKNAILKSLKDADKELEITAFKLDRTEKVKKTTAILLEETIEELEQKRRAVEAQNRDLEIEASLERVRTKAMAMQKTEDLANAVAVVFEELDKLNLGTLRCGIAILDKENRKADLWTTTISDKGMIVQVSGDESMDIHPLLQEVFEAWLQQKDYSYLLQGEDLISYYKALSSANYKLPDSQFIEQQSERLQQYCYVAHFPAGGLYAYRETAFTEEARIVLKRFAEVFNQTYTRYNDLKQAEAQAREAKIEAALERVRSKTMAMHHSEELKEVISVTFEQLKSLNIIIDSCIITLFIEGSNDVNNWVASAEQKYPQQVRVPYFKHPLFDKITLAKNKPGSYFTIRLSKKENQIFYKHILENSDFGKIINEDRRKLVMNADSNIMSFANFQHTGLRVGNFHNYTYTQEENNTILRFANVFEQTYTRFLDLQKAEAQAREAQIEAALERVRSKAMAMHKSDDLKGAVSTVFEELDKLNLGLIRCGIAILDKEKPRGDIWITIKSDSGNTIQTSGDEPLDIHPLLKGAYDAWLMQEDFYYVLQSEDLLSYYQVITKTNFQLPISETFNTDKKDQQQYYFNSVFKDGSLFAFLDTAFTDEAKMVMKRFANVFNLTYKRFLDLQKAEAQAREAKIEASLERVRARAMGMHHSDELSDVLSVLFGQFDVLGISPMYTFLSLIDLEKNCFIYRQTGRGGKRVIAQQIIDLNAMDVWKEVVDRWKAANYDTIETMYVPKELVHETFEVFGEIYATLPEGAKVYPEDFPDGMYATVATSKFGHLGYDHFRPSGEDEKSILLRFNTEFVRLYQRFLDLQKSEAQAREAKIEASLERVRAKTMAMHSSEDVGAATATMFTELEKLEIENVRGGILNIRKDQTMEVWSVNTLDDETIIRAVGTFDMTMHSFWQQLYKGWENKEEFLYYLMAGKEKEDYIRILNARPDYLPNGIQWLPDCHVQSYSFGEGMVWTFSMQPHTEEDKQVMKKFASVFSLTFRRYQDLKKAESQAREATIEAAMEKVRSRALAMQKPNELVEVAQLLRKEMGTLGVEELETSSINIHNEATGKTECWYAIKDNQQERKLVSDHMTIDLNDTWVGREMLRFYNSNEKQVSIVMKGSNRKEWIEYCYNHSPVLTNFFGDNIPDRTYHLYKFSNGFMGAASPGDISAESWDLLQRATSVFSLAYTRFGDLQQAEASTKEAIRQASLDRVRAEIASMRTSTDLEKITPLIWNELYILGVPFIRCGVFIMDDEHELIHTFLSTPDGKAIAAFHLPYTTPGNIAQVLSRWHDKKNYIDHWDESDFTEFAGTLVKQGTLASPEQYLKTIPRGGFYLHFLPFLQGMLYVGNSTQLGEEEIKLIQSVADAFSTAYARYEDFNKLEAAKKQVDSTLNELQTTQKQLIQSEKMASLGELTAGIAHEIQNPLNFVNNFSEVSTELLDEMITELANNNNPDAIAIADNVKQNLEKILHHGKRADGIVKGMLQHSRSSSGVKEPTDINVLVDEYLRLAYHGLRAKDKSFNATLKTDYDETIGDINIIPQDIGRAILNLITNAFYAVSEKKKQLSDGYDPTISVNTKKINSIVEVRVIDNGNGIPQKVLDKIFQPFFTTKPTGQGTGLGLSLSYDIVKAHGGEIKVKTQENEGSEFIITLPLFL